MGALIILVAVMGLIIAVRAWHQRTAPEPVDPADEDQAQWECQDCEALRIQITALSDQLGGAHDDRNRAMLALNRFTGEALGLAADWERRFTGPGIHERCIKDLRTLVMSYRPEGAPR
jgi:hypothetical protein